MPNISFCRKSPKVPTKKRFFPKGKCRIDTHIISRLRFYISPQTNTGIDTSEMNSATSFEIPNTPWLYLLQGTLPECLLQSSFPLALNPPNSRLFLACKKKKSLGSLYVRKAVYKCSTPPLLILFSPSKRDLMFVSLTKKNIIISRTCECTK
ncbi:Uncharacterised protein [Salmonella enterica subsp. enterica]|nr:Uncharacterised protein [Salmonella enterica subsp. enterica]